MPRLSRIAFFLIASLVSVGLISTGFEVAAKDKKKEEKKEDKKDKDKDKKEDKIEKKEPFKPDVAAQEFKPDEKEKSAWVYAVAFGADDKTVAAAYRNFSVKVWDLGTKKAQVLKGPEAKGIGEFKSLLYANNQVFVGSGKLTKKDKDKKEDKDRPIREGEVKVFDAKTGKPGKSILGHLDDIEALAASKDGKWFATGSKDNTVKIWDAAGKDTQTLKGHTDAVTAVSFSPDGKQLVTTSLDRTLRVWDIAGAKELASFKVEREVEKKDPKGKVTKVKEMGRDFTGAVFTSDGKKVIAGNREGFVKIYDVEGKKEMQELKAHEGILTLALSPDGAKFATAGYDQTIKIWDAASGKDLKTIKAHLGNVLTVAFSHDNLWLASGSIDGTVKIWSVK